MSKRALFIFVLVAVICSCADKQQPGDGLLLLSVPKTSVSNKASQQFIKVTASSSWTLTAEFEAGQLAWAKLDRTSGSSSSSDIILSWDENTTLQERRCTLTLKSSDKQSQVVFVQAQGLPSDDNTGLHPDKLPSWLELPSTEAKGRFFFTHDMTLGNGKTTRNYSYHLDTTAKVAAWVAYPLNNSLIGNGQRTDEWGLDPKVPERYQPVVYKAFRGGYDRGHQLPSADRLNRNANVTTFYGVNMTPQKNSLNSFAWATLEGKVRDCSRQLDTLYVVTGADLRGVKEYAFDNVGKKIAVPTGYYKALLGYKEGGSLGNLTSGYIGIAFYFEHRGYQQNDVKAQSMSIDELEKKLGMDFFVNLPDKIGKEKADKVESAPDEWWYKIINR